MILYQNHQDSAVINKLKYYAQLLLMLPCHLVAATKPMLKMVILLRFPLLQIMKQG